MEEEKEDPIARKKRLQHEAYRRWYTSPKGAEYRQRQKERLALGKPSMYAEPEEEVK